MQINVLTPYYDEPLWMIKRNVDSVRRQLLPDGFKLNHVISIDRPKGEASKDVIDYLDKQEDLTLVSPAKNGGLSAARNMGIFYSYGEYIFLLDTDDSMPSNYPTRIADQVSYMKENNLDHSYGAYSPIHGDSPEPKDQICMPPPYEPLSELIKGVNPCFCGSNVFKRSIIEEIGNFDESMKDGAEDMEFWIRIAKHPDLKSKRFEAGGKALYYLGIHGNNMTARYLAEKRFEKAYAYIKEKHTDLDFKF